MLLFYYDWKRKKKLYTVEQRLHLPCSESAEESCSSCDRLLAEAGGMEGFWNGDGEVGPHEVCYDTNTRSTHDLEIENPT